MIHNQKFIKKRKMLSWRSKEPSNTETKNPNTVPMWRRKNENQQENTPPIMGRPTAGRSNDRKHPRSEIQSWRTSNNPTPRPKRKLSTKELKIVGMLARREDYLKRFLVYMLVNGRGHFKADADGFFATDEIIKHPHLVKRKISIQDINRVTYASNQYELKEVGQTDKYKLKLNVAYDSDEEELSDGVGECLVLVEKNMNLD
jgi:hypothetical protein